MGGGEEGKTDLVENSLVVVFLEESLLAALLLLARLFGPLRVLLDAQFFRQRATCFDFLADLFEPVHPDPTRNRISHTGKERLETSGSDESGERA